MRLYSLAYPKELNSGFGGWSNLFFVKIAERYKSDAGLLAHEVEHVKQFYRLWILCTAIGVGLGLWLNMWCIPVVLSAAGFAAHNTIYSVWDWYKLRCEVAAYRTQLRVYGPNTSPKFAIDILTTRYNLNVSRAEVARMLTE